MRWRGLLASRAQLLVNPWRVRRGRGGLLLGLTLVTLFFILVLAGLGVTFAALDPLGLGAAHGAAVLAAVLTAALCAALVFDLQHAVSAMLLDSDLELLRRAPVSARALLGIKLLDSLPRTGALIACVALPATLAFLAVVGGPAWAWLLLPVLLAGLWAAPLGVGVAGALVLLRLVPARRVREALAVLSTFLMLALWLVNSFAMPRLLGDQTRLAPRLFERLTPARWVIEASPPHWAAEALLAAHDGHPLQALGWALRLSIVAALSLGLAGIAARALLEEVLARVAAGEGRTRSRRGSLPLPAGRVSTLLVKDARLFLRDWGVLGDVLTAALLWTLLPLVAGPLHPLPSPVVGRFMLVALAVGLGYEVGARTVPYEGPALAWTRLAPLGAWRWNGAKWLGGALVSLPLLAIAGLVTRVGLQLDVAAWAEAVAAGIGALALSLALGLWTGWRFGDPHWTHPRAMLTFSGRLVASGLLLLQAGAWIGALLLAEALRDELPPGALVWGPLLVGVALALLTMTIVLRAARRHEWSD